MKRNRYEEVVDLTKSPESKISKTNVIKKKASFNVLTYNIWFEEHIFGEDRMFAISRIVLERRPDFVAFQECTENLFKILKNNLQSYTFITQVEAGDITLPYFTALGVLSTTDAEHIRIEKTKYLHFRNSKMGRGVLCMQGNILIDGIVIFISIATSHFESPLPRIRHIEERNQQLQQCLNLLSPGEGEEEKPYISILMGDLNWIETGPNLEDKLQSPWVDVALELGKDDQHTYDQKANPMLLGNKYKSRLDRILCSSNLGITSTKLDLLGRERIRNLEFTKRGKLLFVLPSDHYGLYYEATIETQSENVEN
eukprot:snap_masked-scaffold_15-processed-gene-5.30-mRNA-1 protein AED:1.00 eAED:1.00 QI:0/-1/0/0/-1/1/1/0/311